MKRTQLNLAIDIAAFAAFLFLFSTGILLRYQLPAGSGGLYGRGSGHGAGERSVTLLWGWTRHEWGDIHYWIAGILLAILAVHVVLHWKWIVCAVRSTRSDASGKRFAVGIAACLALVVLATAPLLAPTDVLSRQELQQQSYSVAASSEEHEPEIRGSMTVEEVASAANLSVEELLTRLNLPKDLPANERIGRLLRRHGLQMADLRQSLAEAATNLRRSGDSKQ